ncbi:hypothetical protein ACN38_g1343 [Penicillium nordicum]|uniref:Uncharacterized protein n=1 Tax=Penicillium nordicum TaxID=229535 RepID=A0A0M8PFQ2_9EURO|nr:hypothetical protein ACN38_g1343 [Penicillium nordicum]
MYGALTMHMVALHLLSPKPAAPFLGLNYEDLRQKIQLRFNSDSVQIHQIQFRFNSDSIHFRSMPLPIAPLPIGVSFDSFCQLLGLGDSKLGEEWSPIQRTEWLVNRHGGYLNQCKQKNKTTIDR